MTGPIERLRERTAELSDLGRISGLLDWDQQTMMPPQGGPGRAEGRATIERLRHELFISGDTGELIDAAEAMMRGSSGSPPAGARRPSACPRS